MLKVQSIVDNLFSFFHDEIEQEVHVNFKVDKCKVSSIVQRIGKKELRLNISTDINFDKSSMLAVASSDGPCRFTFYSQKLFSNQDLKAFISNDDLCPLRISSLMHWYPYKSSISQKVSILFKVLPFSGDVFDKSFFDYKTSTRFSSRFCSVRFDTSHHLSQLSLEGILKIRPLIAANFFFFLTRQSLTKASVVAQYRWRSACAAALLSAGAAGVAGCALAAPKAGERT